MLCARGAFACFAAFFLICPLFILFPACFFSHHLHYIRGVLLWFSNSLFVAIVSALFSLFHCLENRLQLKTSAFNSLPPTFKWPQWFPNLALSPIAALTKTLSMPFYFVQLPPTSRFFSFISGVARTSTRRIQFRRCIVCRYLWKLLITVAELCSLSFHFKHKRLNAITLNWKAFKTIVPML